MSLTAGLVGAAIGGSVLNSYLQWNENQYQHDLQRDIFNREDTSIQRRVADLKAAGLSPVLAAGQGAGTGGVVSTTVPQTDVSAKVIDALSLMKMEADIATTVEQRKLIQKQVEQAGASINNTNADAAIKWHDFKVYEKSGLPSNASSAGKTIRDLFGVSDSPVIQSQKDKLIEKILKAAEVYDPLSSGNIFEAQRKLHEQWLQEGIKSGRIKIKK